MFVARVVRILGAGLALLALSSCSKSLVEQPSTTAQQPVFEQSGLIGNLIGPGVTPTGSLSATKTIDGSVGGTISAGSWRIDVPPGAYKGSATITLAQPDPTVLLCNIGISPLSANQFAVPVKLTCKMPNTLAVLLDQILWLDSNLLWRLLSTDRDLVNLEISTKLSHFSTYAAGRAGW